jgi:hypothetical protein
MYSLLLKLVPADVRALIEMATRVVAHLDTGQERKAFAEYVLKALETDGSLTVGEWASIGSRAGILRGRRKGEAGVEEIPA